MDGRLQGNSTWRAAPLHQVMYAWKAKRERRPFIDYAYMVKIPFLLQAVELLEATYIVKMCSCSKPIKSMAVPSLESKEERVRAERKSRKRGSELPSCEKMSMCGTLDRAQNKQVKIKPQSDGRSPCIKFLQTEDRHVAIRKLGETVLSLLPFALTNRGQSCVNSFVPKPGAAVLCFLLFCFCFSNQKSD